MGSNESDDAMVFIKSGFNPRLAAALIGAGLLAGCTTTDDAVSTLFVGPGGYDLYSCPQLQQSAGSLRARRTELEGLMARAERDADGKFMSAIGYRPDYLRVRGELHEVEKAAREKQCDLSVPLPKASRTAKPAQPPAPRAAPDLVKPR